MTFLSQMASPAASGAAPHLALPGLILSTQSRGPRASCLVGWSLSGQGTLFTCSLGWAGSDEVEGDASGGALHVGSQEEDLGVASEGEAVKNQQREKQSLGSLAGFREWWEAGGRGGRERGDPQNPKH